VGLRQSLIAELEHAGAAEMVMIDAAADSRCCI
jgi:hypothetical protein